LNLVVAAFPRLCCTVPPQNLLHLSQLTQRQRGFEANLRMLKTADDMPGSIIDTKR
jgi:hypothetical protein